MTTTKNKRWNGKIETLKGDYLKDVIRQMETYGDRVQFTLGGSAQGPNYQVINSAGKKMAFDNNHHLLHPQDNEFTGSNATGVITLDQVKTALAGGGKASGTTRVGGVGSGSSRSSAAAVKAKDLVDTEKYAYFKNNRQMLPRGIEAHSDEITELMKKGMSAEEAFSEIVKRHF
ncbi:hypothetical protein D3878_01495 [Noviherbaspirillum sedimenti]|uniref:Uncharacterized protein n=1 Tax=Noviherbaspirillum sedimenti TaxID=2320865 RepID=A0A3A3GBW8_9BURK|nr:hypothetical protein D3878_01495 [Noviherbaspirillum sedimenti]